MKKRATWMLALGLAAAMLMTGCGSDSTTNAAAETEAETEMTTEVAETEAVVYTAADILAPLSYDVTEYVTLADYSNLEINIGTEYQVTDEEVEDWVKQFAEAYPSYYTDSDKTVVEEGVSANIDYVGSVDGVEFAGGTAQGYDLVIGSGAFIDGFESSLIGAEVGQTIDINVTFPSDYGNTELAGQDAVFTVTINSIKEAQTVTYETINDEWAASNFYSDGITTVEGVRELIRTYLEESAEESKESAAADLALEQLMEASEITIPEGYLEQRKETYQAAVYAAIEANESTFEDFMGQTEEEFLESLDETIETRVRRDLFYEALVQDMDVSITSSDVDSYIAAYVYYYGYEDAEAVYAELGSITELSGEEYVKLAIASQSAWSQVVENITIVEE